MIKTLAKSVREFKRPAILTLIFIMGEVFIEIRVHHLTCLSVYYSALVR